MNGFGGASGVPVANCLVVFSDADTASRKGPSVSAAPTVSSR
ncbi:Uncharacterised protein [Mycobacteroides abscessus subsp. abscessus]|nr:Uncharacterised protein [Mycobacteroides abscessus subsp. abscessus]